MARMANHDVVRVNLEKDLREILAGQYRLASDIAEAISQRFVDTGFVNNYEHAPVFDLLTILHKVGVDAGTIYERGRGESAAAGG